MNIKKLGVSVGAVSAIVVAGALADAVSKETPLDIYQLELLRIVQRDAWQGCLDAPGGPYACYRERALHFGSDRPTQGQAFEAEAWNVFSLVIQCIWLLLLCVLGFLVPYAAVVYGTRLFTKWANWVRA